MVQQFSLNIQTELKEGWLMEVGYVGARGTRLQRFRSLNQAQDAFQAQMSMPFLLIRLLLCRIWCEGWSVGI